MKLFVLEYPLEGGSDLRGVYSSLEKAQQSEHLKSWVLTWTQDRENYWIGKERYLNPYGKEVDEVRFTIAQIQLDVDIQY